MTLGLTSAFDKLKLKSCNEEENSARESPDLVSENTDDIDELDNEGQSILMGIISQLRLGCDLSKITLPTFILEKKSMLERITNFFQIPDLLLDANATDDSVERFLGVLKWYLASWHIAPKAVKKPLNPISGEIFCCSWKKLPGNNTAYYVSEQVSHHPPKSSYFYLVPESKIRVDGVVIPQSKFLGNSSAAIMEGIAQVTLGDRDGETYIMNQPNVYCRGILFGKLRMELGDHMFIKCPKSGLEADIEFKTKGLIGGTYDAIEGFVYDTKTASKLFKVSGKWNDVMRIQDLNQGTCGILYDTSSTKTSLPDVRRIEDQVENESRRLWLPTVQALGRRDHNSATEEKFKVENEQRRKAKEMHEKNQEFVPQYFASTESTDVDDFKLEYVLKLELNLSDNPEILKRTLTDAIPLFPSS